MNIVNKLTLRHLKENKGRTILTILGIIVSVAMITAVFVAGASFLDFMGNEWYMSDGHYHFKVTSDYKDLKKNIEDDSRVDSVGYMANISDGMSGFKLNTKADNYKKTGAIAAGDQSYLKKIITAKYEGSLPKNENEIIIEESLLTDGGLKAGIGDTVQIPVGRRYKGVESITVTVGGIYQYGEKFEKRDTKSYKIVGILHNNKPTTNMGIKILRGMSDSEYNGSLTAYAELKKLGPGSYTVIKDIISKFNFSKKDAGLYSSIHDDYLFTKMAISKNNETAVMFLSLCAIILAIIMIASIVLIYNAFGMSFSEKVRYLGMLSSVGATKSQKRKSIYFEGLIEGAIGIPLGILFGIIGISITLKAIGPVLLSSGMIDINSTDLWLNTVVPLSAIVGIIIVSALTIFISIAKPAIKASKITPIDAIRQQSEIKRKKKIHSPAIIRKTLGYEGELAYKNLKRNGRKSFTIIVSIALSVVLFLSCTYFCECLNSASKMDYQKPYQIDMVYTTNTKGFKKFENMLSENSDIKRFYSTNCYLFSKEHPLEQEKFDIIKSKDLSSDYQVITKQDILLYVNFIDDSAFDSLCKANNIDSSKYYEKKSIKKVLVMNNISHKEGDDNVFTDNLKGEVFGIRSVDEAESEKNKDVVYSSTKLDNGYEVGDFAKYDKDNYVCNLNGTNSISAYIPISVERYIEFDSNDEEYQRSYGIETDNPAKVTEELNKFLSQKEKDDTFVNNIKEQSDAMNATILIFRVFIYGFIVLITLITMFNIINTISTSIALRRKEFAMLKSVGTTPKGLTNMVVLESAFYGIWALIVGLPLSIGISKFMNVSVTGSTPMPFKINWLLYLAVVAVVFLLIGITMLYSINKMKNDSIIETLKDDIN